MKKSSLLLFPLLISSLTSLSSCGEEVVEEPKEIPLTSLRDGFACLYQTKNYTLKVDLKVNGVNSPFPYVMFTEEYAGFDSGYEELVDFVVKDNNGLFRVTIGDDYQAGEYYVDENGNNYTSLFDNTVVKSMYGVCGSYIAKNVTKDITTFNVTDKEYKKAFIEMLGFDSAYYANVDSLVANYNDGVVTFIMKTENNTNEFNITLMNIGITSSRHYKIFKEKGYTALNPDKGLKEMRRLMNLDNMVHRVYSFGENGGYFSGYEFMTDKYFYLSGEDWKNGYSYMEFNYDGKGVEHDLCGVYLVNVKDGVASLQSLNPINTKPSIEDCFHYPKKMSFLYNLEFVKKGNLRGSEYQYNESQADRYYITDSYYVSNVASNFSLDKQFEGVTFTGVSFELKLNYENQAESIVIIHVLMKYGQTTYDCLLPLFNFGIANNVSLDALSEKYNNR